MSDPIHEIDFWLDSQVPIEYQEQRLAQNWARISKIGEELGEAIQNFIGYTGQNPRKGVINSLDEVIDELCDVVLTGTLAIQHLVKDADATRTYIDDRWNFCYRRIFGKDITPID